MGDHGYHVRDCASLTNVMQAGDPITAVTNLRTIAERLAWAREELKLSQEQLALAAGVAQGTIGNLESGLRKNPRELLAIARAAKVNAEWLKTGKGPVRPIAAVEVSADPVAADSSADGFHLIPASEYDLLQAVKIKFSPREREEILLDAEDIKRRVHAASLSPPAVPVVPTEPARRRKAG
jgi:transcriptional regulator with XRE-family HTH domain